MMPSDVSEKYRQEFIRLVSSKTKLSKASNPKSQSNLKPKTSYPHDAFSEELKTISGKLEGVSSKNLIDTYGIIDKRRTMANRPKRLKLRTQRLRAELNKWDNWDARLTRLVDGDGLDSNLGRLNRDVL